jgi:di/tricarboxylate transporter
MTFEMWITIGVLVLLVSFLLSTRVNTDVAVIGSLVLLLLFGVLDTSTAFAGFISPGPLMIGGLFVVAAGLRETGAVDRVAKLLLGSPKSLRMAQFRMMVPVSVLSGFMNTTAIVAMYLPIVSDWSKRIGSSPSKLYMPLSFSAILGGQLSQIGTASNLVILGLFITWSTSPESDWFRQLGGAPLSSQAEFWGVAATGVPAMIIGITFILFASRWLLPERINVKVDSEDSRKYEVAMMIDHGSPLIGKSIEEAGLRALPGLYLFGIHRDSSDLHAVGPDQILQENDRLLFTGILDSVVDLTRIRGLVPADGDSGLPRSNSLLVEAVVSDEAPFIGMTVKECDFRNTYRAAIIGAFRSGERLTGKIGDLKLRPGDTLLLDTSHGFSQSNQDNKDFYLVSDVQGARSVRHERSTVSIILLLGMITLLVTGWTDKVVAVWLCAILMVGTRCIPGNLARSSINWQVFLTIGGAIGLGAAVSSSGLSALIAEYFQTTVGAFGNSPHIALLLAIMMTAILAQFVTNYGAATIMFSIVMPVAELLELSPYPFVFGLMAGAGCNFLTPIAYQTNLMVYGPGGYRFTDFIRLGLPLLVIVISCALLIIPLFFPFSI